MGHIIKKTIGFLQKKSMVDAKDIIPTVGELLPEAIEKIERACSNKGKLTGIPTGFMDLDYLTSGLQKKELIVIASRPAMGKTAFALNIAEYVSVISKKHAVFFNLAMPKEQLLSRLLSSLMLVSAMRIRNGELSENELKNVFDGVTTLSKTPLYIDDTTSNTVQDIRIKCEKMKTEGKLDLIIIDNIQYLATAERNKDNWRDDTSRIAGSLKNLAHDLDIPVVCLSQLTRAPDHRKNHRPILTDLRDYGHLEEVADIVMFPYRDAYYNYDTELHNDAEIIVAKNRNGSTGIVILKWLKKYMKFSQYDEIIT